MKKFIAIFVLFFAFCLTTSAQSADVKQKVNNSPEAKAKQNVLDLSKNMDLDDQQVLADLFQLFVKKHKDLDAATTETEKAAISAVIDAKLRATFKENQIKSLQRVEGLYDKLIK
jgi:hypothetical protein